MKNPGQQRNGFVLIYLSETEVSPFFREDVLKWGRKELWETENGNLQMG